MKKFSYYRIRSVDYISDFASGAIIIPPLVFYVMGHFLGLEAVLTNFKYLAIGSILIGIFFLVWRRHFFYLLYFQGVDVKGHVVSANEFKKGGARVEYKYMYLGENYWTGNTLTDSAFRKNHFCEGDEVILRVDPKNPKRAVIKDLYF